jgi:ribosomal protein S1
MKNNNIRQYMTETQFQSALKTGETNGNWMTDRQWSKVLREVWRKNGQVYGQVVEPVKNGYNVDLLGQRAFMYGADAHPDTEDYIGKKLIFEIKKFETTQWKGRPQTNIIVTNNIYREE